MKVLADGQLTKALTVRAHTFSAKAQERIAGAGGKAEVSSPRGRQACCRASATSGTFPDLRKRVLFTLGLLAVYRLGNHIPTPGINAAALIDFFEQNRGNWFGLVDMFSGGNLAQVTIFALGIMPYISASIILQLLTVVWPYLEKLSKEGELGPPQDHAVHALRHGAALDRAVARHRGLPGAPDARGPASGSSTTPAWASS